MCEFCNSGGSRPEIIDRIWESWQDSGGKGPCADCPQHWSRRVDLPDKGPDGDSNNYGLNPWFGEGHFDPRVVILAEEPGWHKPEPDDNQLSSSFSQTRPCIIDVASESNTIVRMKPLFKRLHNERYSTYYTNISKCNALPYRKSQKESTKQELRELVEQGNISPESLRFDIDEKAALDDMSEENEKAQSLCCGVDRDTGFLHDELNALSPEAVISVGKTATKNLLNIYDSSDKLGTFTQTTTSGELPSGINPIEAPNAPFDIVPALHPSLGFNHADEQFRESLESVHESGNQKEGYYKQFGADFLQSVL